LSAADQRAISAPFPRSLKAARHRTKHSSCC
jgi:hypothetical protein